MKVTEIVKDNNIYQLNLEGRFDANTCGNIESFIRKKIEDGVYMFVLNMENVSFVASAGLRVVLVIARELRVKYKGDLRLASLQVNVNKVFEISGLDNVLRIFDDVETAVQSFK